MVATRAGRIPVALSYTDQAALDSNTQGLGRPPPWVGGA